MFGLESIIWPPDGGIDLAVRLAVRTCFVYVLFLVAMRIFGKREVGQFTMPDLVLVLLAANALQPAITGPDTSLGGAVVILVTMFFLNAAVIWLRARFVFVDRLVSPDPAPIYGTAGSVPAVPEGVLSIWRSQGLTSQDVLEALHERGLEDLRDVERIWLEESGRITVIPKAAGTAG